ncbi:hypothetical protein FPSE_08787 [Fusarium pseudograminearum CS3096]|uniref:Uncharacterized protein n=1 Tax=Fusarium pseudograminearum (strain CS3096) TaxID=1028729 RepID=K3UGV2_FUSPC|nr:hypothetical protein FPSE_08787 [Fusarium pseudograminearum CS3096]EKJ71051.1 hypothetical protein FPSE_08787 [Fusarium pseudograminearum CS3096]
MSTEFETMYHSKDHLGSPSSILYPDYEAIEATELSYISQASSSTNSLPVYTEIYNKGQSAHLYTTVADFYPTKQFQIQASGIPLIKLPVPPRPDPIYTFNVSPTGEIEEAEYVSIRPARKSGSCFLARADDRAQKPLCTTTYRYGPGNPPKIRLDTETSQGRQAEDIEISCKGIMTRSVVMRTHLGTFEWRYSSRAERRAFMGEKADSLLILEQVTKVAVKRGKQEERRRKVGHFVRNSGVRTPGSNRSTAGNGGRLMLDLQEWVDRKEECAEMEILAVASCISMLKKEVDRRRVHQTMAMMGGGS